MENIYLKEDDESDITRIDKYNQEYISIYPNFVPFVTKENYKDFLKEVEEKKQGINNNGVKEIYYWMIEDDTIIGSGSIRINPEADEQTERYSGHIMYSIVPSKRKQGYGTLLCHMLLEKMNLIGLEEAIITCDNNNVESASIIQNNGGKLIDIIDGDGQNKDAKTRRYVINIKTSLLKFDNQSKHI